MNSSRLHIFLKQTFGEEGSFQKNPKDKGNYHDNKLYGTIWGISAKNHFGTFWKCYHLWNIGKVEESREIAREFYIQSRYWDDDYALINDSSLAFRIWDFGVNAGVFRAVKLLQKTLNKNYNTNLIEDGVFGKYTLLMTNKFAHPKVNFHLAYSEIITGETECYTLYVKALERFYRSLWNFLTFGSGWLSRLKRVFNGCPDLYEGIRYNN